MRIILSSLSLNLQQTSFHEQQILYLNRTSFPHIYEWAERLSGGKDIIADFFRMYIDHRTQQDPLFVHTSGIDTKSLS
jgi:hypothetical protein